MFLRRNVANAGRIGKGLEKELEGGGGMKRDKNGKVITIHIYNYQVKNIVSGHSSHI